MQEVLDNQQKKEITLIRTFKENMGKEGGKTMDSDDSFMTSMTDDLRQLSQLEKCFVKNEIKNMIFRYQI